MAEWLIVCCGVYTELALIGGYNNQSETSVANTRHMEIPNYATVFIEVIALIPAPGIFIYISLSLMILTSC